MIAKNLVVKIHNLVVNDKSRPIKSNTALHHLQPQSEQRDIHPCFERSLDQLNTQKNNETQKHDELYKYNQTQQHE